MVSVFGGYGSRELFRPTRGRRLGKGQVVTYRAL